MNPVHVNDEVQYLSTETALEDLTDMDVSMVSGYNHSRADHTQYEDRFDAAQRRLSHIPSMSDARDTATL